LPPIGIHFPMTNDLAPDPRSILQDIARRVMCERGLEPDFSPAALAELRAITGPAPLATGTSDLRSLLWCSIDNDDSRDLDQLSAGEALANDRIKLYVAIADVAALVPPQSAIDAHARQNTTSVYTVAKIFPMLPERLSTDLTSLNFEEDRLAVVVTLVVAPSGEVEKSDIVSALVRNRAKLAYGSVARWFEGDEAAPAAVAAVPGLGENLRLQLAAAKRLKALRHTRGALDFDTIETRPVFVDGKLSDLAVAMRNSAKDLIEDLMIATNGATAAYLEKKKFPSIRRIVRTPKHWDRIVELAAERGASLPVAPDPRALEQFLVEAKASDPERFPDLSLSVIKLLGAGEYVLETPDKPSAGHFGLAVKDYAHSTAPNRRYPDLITQRLLKAALAGARPPYKAEELDVLASHCTAQEDAAKKVERQVVKSAAALLLQARVGETFDALVTGASPKGTWVRLAAPPIEGKLVRGFEGRRVGQRLRVQLLHTDANRGLIDFAAA
jgi:exoribonuclease-2